MFSRVAGRYDLLNHLLSLNIDRYWRVRTVRRLRGILHRAGARVLDICCGTGDLLLALESERGAAVMGSDFCHPMLVAAGRKMARRKSQSALVEADALALPFPDGSLDLITAAFGFRNLANYEKGLTEIRRALKPDGAVAILEFSRPTNSAFAESPAKAGFVLLSPRLPVALPQRPERPWASRSGRTRPRLCALY
jgi:demethylmenaquinone methyltransferase/2-methoxy-6-polyprenyl-1,4-benzoquinol methylase